MINLSKFDYSIEKKENVTEVPKPVLRKKIARPPVPAESRLSKISIKSSTPPKCENPQRKSVEVLNEVPSNMYIILILIFFV